MIDVVVALAVGVTAGAAFAMVGLPVPAPPTVAGVAGVLGVTLGFIVITRMRGG